MVNATTTALPAGALGAVSPYLTASLVGVALPLLLFFSLRSTSNGKVLDLGGIPVLTAWTFFSKRFDFIQSNFKRSGGTIFRFRVLQVGIIFTEPYSNSI